MSDVAGQPLLGVEGLGVSLVPGTPTLERISLRVAPGEVVAIVGSNGAGKSTLLRTISGLHQVRSGAIRLEGEEIQAWSPRRRVRAGLGHVLEGRQLFAEMTVEENLRMGGYLRPLREVGPDVARLKERFPLLASRAGQPAGTLSGGEQQLLAIGRALMGRPRLLLMDEPSIGLAPKVVAEIGGVVRSLASEDGIGVLLVEQNAQLAFGLASFVYVLELGEMRVSGPTEEVAASELVKEAYLST